MNVAHASPRRVTGVSNGPWRCSECGAEHPNSERHNPGCTNTVCRECHLRGRHRDGCTKSTPQADEPEASAITSSPSTERSTE